MVKHQINSDVTQVRKLARKLKNYSDELELDRETRGLLEIMLVEAVNNIIIHAYDNTPGSLLEMQLDADDEEITVTLIDEGSYFPGKVFYAKEGMPDCKDLPEGNWGVGLIHTIADSVERYNVNGMNIMVMSKRLAPEMLAEAAC